MHTHEKIRKLREAKDLTQEYMAHELNISPKTYSRVENGESPMKVEHLLKISELLEVPVEDLLSPNPVTINIEKQDSHAVDVKDHGQGVGILNGSINNNYQGEINNHKTVEERLSRLEEMVERLVTAMGKA